MSWWWTNMLIIENLVKTFTNHAIPVLNGIDLKIKAGEFCVLLGANGSGKSTLLKTITGEIRIDSGRIELNNQELTPLSVAARAISIACVAQDTHKGTIAQMTLLENIVLSLLRAQKATLRSFKRQTQLIIDKIAELGIGLEDFIHKPMQVLSGGQRQMVATVMATLASPQLLLLDEHCSALDPKAQKKVMSFTNQIIQKQALTTVMITHDLPDALEYGNRLIMLKQGKIILDADEKMKQNLTASDLLAHYHSGEVL